MGERKRKYASLSASLQSKRYEKYERKRGMINYGKWEWERER